MPEAVIVATARSPIGRAMKGSLISVRPDDLLAHAYAALAGDASGEGVWEMIASEFGKSRGVIQS